jgi:signal transduction histidine kinase
VIEVQDSGVGLDPEHVNRILDPFFSTEPGGLGMELAIIRSIVQVHAERLRARPNDGAGVTMHVALPAGAGDAR